MIFETKPRPLGSQKEGIETAQKVLDDRLKHGDITPEMYQKQSLLFRKQLEDLEKKEKQKH